MNPEIQNQYNGIGWGYCILGSDHRPYLTIRATAVFSPSLSCLIFIFTSVAPASADSGTVNYFSPLAFLWRKDDSVRVYGRERGSSGTRCRCRPSFFSTQWISRYRFLTMCKDSTLSCPLHSLRFPPFVMKAVTGDQRLPSSHWLPRHEEKSQVIQEVAGSFSLLEWSVPVQLDGTWVETHPGF